MSPLATSLLLMLVNALASVSAASGAQPQPVVEEPGVSGYALAPDGTPVSGGTVAAQAGMVSTTASIDSTGRFRLVPMRSGSHQVLVSVPGLAPYRATVTVPDSRSLRLPVIRLAAGAYFRVRLVSPAGEPIMAPQLRRRLFDASGKPIFVGGRATLRLTSTLRPALGLPISAPPHVPPLPFPFAYHAPSFGGRRATDA